MCIGSFADARSATPQVRGNGRALLDVPYLTEAVPAGLSAARVREGLLSGLLAVWPWGCRHTAVGSNAAADKARRAATLAETAGPGCEHAFICA